MKMPADPSSLLADSPLLGVCSHGGDGGGQVLVALPLIGRALIPSLRSHLHGLLHPHPITSQRPHLELSSHLGAGLQHGAALTKDALIEMKSV